MDTTKIKNLDNIDIHKEYSGGNKLIHLIIIQKNKTLLQEYINKNYDLNLLNLSNNTPYHLLLTSAYDIDMFKKIINHKVCWNNLNHDNISILDLILTNNHIFDLLQNYHKYFMTKDIITSSFLNSYNICTYLTPNNIIKYQHIIDFKGTKKIIPLFQLIHNNYITSISTFIKKLKNYNQFIHIFDLLGNNLLGKFILHHKLNINKKSILLEINKLVNIGFTPNYQNPITGIQPFKILLIYVKDKQFLINYYKNNNINPNIIDNYGNNLGIFTTLLYNKKNYKKDKLLSLIIKDSDKEHTNILGNSINSLNNKSNTPDTNNNIKLIPVLPVNTTEFSARLDDIILFFILLQNKYNNLHIPKFNKNISSTNLDFNFNSISLPTDLPITLDLLPFFISFKNQDIYYVHPYLNLIINNLFEKYPKHYAIVFLSFQENNNLHANILLYDFKNKTITRFEPYGNTEILDNNLDDIISEELTWNTQFKYIKPSQYMSGSGLQSLSDENNIINKKPGDFGGFCLAWCLWFIEMKLTNHNISTENLINKSIKKIIKNNSLIEYIRSYSNKITKQKYNIYKKINLPQNVWSNISLNSDHNNIIFKEISRFINL